MDNNFLPQNDGNLLLNVSEILPLENFLEDVNSEENLDWLALSPPPPVDPMDFIDCLLQDWQSPHPQPQPQPQPQPLFVEQNLEPYRSNKEEILQSELSDWKPYTENRPPDRPFDLENRLKALVHSKVEPKLTVITCKNEDTRATKHYLNEDTEVFQRNEELENMQTFAQDLETKQPLVKSGTEIPLFGLVKLCEKQSRDSETEFSWEQMLTPNGSSQWDKYTSSVYKALKLDPPSSSNSSDKCIHSRENCGSIVNSKFQNSKGDNTWAFGLDGMPNSTENTILDSLYFKSKAEFSANKKLSTNPGFFPMNLPFNNVSKRARRNSNAGLMPVPSLKRNLQLDTSRNLLQTRLLSFAEAVATGDEERSRYLLTLLKDAANPKGDAWERVTYYSLEALKLRELGKGSSYMAQLPAISSEQLNSSINEFLYNVPLLPVVDETVIGFLLDAFENEDKIHVIELGLKSRGQWETLLLKLSRRPGGPPKHLSVTFIDAIQPHHPKFEHESGAWMDYVATSLGISFQWRVLRTKLVDLNPSMLVLKPGEALVIHLGMSLQSLPDDSVLRSNPRGKFLEMLHELDPKVVILTDLSYNLNSPFFLRRFKECFECFSHVFDLLGSTCPADSEHRLFIEERLLGEELVNVIACEGLEMWFRTENLDKWQSRMRRAGFTTQPVRYHVLEGVKEVLRSFNMPDFSVSSDQGAVEMKFKGLPTLFTCAFRQRF